MSITVGTKTSPEKATKKAGGPTAESPGYAVVQKVLSGETFLVMAQSQIQLEDEFSSLYYTVQNQSNIFLQPPYDPQQLLTFCQTNNVLNQCIEAMEVNIDSTGHEFIPSDMADAQVQKARDAWKKKQTDKTQQKLQDAADHANTTALAMHKASQTPPADPVLAVDDKTLLPGPSIPADIPEPLKYEVDDPQPEFGNGIDPDELLKAKEFFNEPYPGVSFTKIRRKLRREIESVGYGYLEVLRNPADEIVGLRNVEPHQTRMVKLDAPILVEKTIMRGGKEQKIQIWERQRRFALRVALKQLVYYREYGTARHVDRNTGKWEVPPTATDPGYPVDVGARGTELMIFGIHPDATTPYFVPRWINELPSVIGSRKAEELNLEFLDSGGMPPAIIFIQGGTLAKDAADQLKLYLSGKNKNKHRAVVVEAQSSSGSLESAGSVQVKVERFGSERANDAMYVKYDEATEEHIRVGFRMPPLFLGKAADYNLATAVTAYMVAEEQVFQPERTSFDDQINNTLIKDMGFKTLRLKSNPISLSDATNQVAALAQAKGTVTTESFVKALNTVTGLDLEASEAVLNAPGAAPGAPGAPPAFPGAPPAHAAAGGSPGAAPGLGGASDGIKNLSIPDTALKADLDEPLSAMQLINLAQDYLAVKGLVAKREVSKVRATQVRDQIERLTKKEQRMFNSLVASYTYGSAEPDLVNIAAHTHAH